ncbi:folate-binding protein YgfZ [Rickettsia sp. Oklahoma-10]|uniref:Folate-binding protein YgfZ n=1 Tax=Rickettsia oklahomensis TaxID=3141789 RepID=A0AAU7BZ80_9RICK
MYEILNDREVVKIIGLDSVKFLQNLITNDINKSKYCYTYLLNNQGRYLFDFFVYIHNFEEIYLDIDKSSKTVLIDHLNFYKLRSKIQLIDCSDEYKVIYSHQKLDIDTLVTSRDPRYTKLGLRSIVTGTLKDTLEPLCHSREDGNSIYLEDKYNFAIIDGVEDLSFNKSIPILYGGEELNGISYDKGCYVGQEVISRTKYQGVIRRRIYTVIADEDLSSLVKDEAILADNYEIGVICSSYYNKAIALIREEKYLAFKDSGITVKGISIELSLAPWY